MINKFNIIFCIILLFSAGCGKRTADVEPVSNLDFNKYFSLVQKFDIVSKMKGIRYFGLNRGPGRMEIAYIDGTEAWFYQDDYENVNVFKKGSTENNSEKEIISDIHNLIDFYFQMQLKGIEHNLKDSIYEIWFDLNAINKETLPVYNNPNLITEKYYFNEGVLVYSYGIDFNKTLSYKNLEHTKIQEHWYLAY